MTQTKSTKEKPRYEESVTEEERYEGIKKEGWAYSRNFLLALSTFSLTTITSNIFSNFLISRMPDYPNPEKPPIVEYTETANSIKNNLLNDLVRVKTPEEFPYPEGEFIDLLKNKRELEKHEKVGNLETSLTAVKKDLKKMRQTEEYKSYQEDYQIQKNLQEQSFEEIQEIDGASRRMNLIGFFGMFAFLTKGIYHIHRGGKFLDMRIREVEK
jgi:hypothetical protein